MTTWLSGVGVVLRLELLQRVRGKAWYILLGIFTLLVALVTLLLWLTLGSFGGDTGGGIFSTLIYFVLLLGTLVAPAVSGNAINGDRAAGTLATTQITLITTWQLVLGKFLAAWISALAFLVAAVPFLILAVFLGGIRPDTIVVSVLVLAVELGVLAAVGVGLSGLLTRPLFSIVVTYLVVAALSVGTLIAFGLLSLTVQSTVTYSYEYAEFDPQTGEQVFEGGRPVCSPPEVVESQVPRYDHFWGALVANPYVVLADAAPTGYDENGSPQDLFGFIKLGARSAQVPPELEVSYSDCVGVPLGDEAFESAQDIIESTTPGWFVGLTLHLMLAAGLLVGGWNATRTPTGRLPSDSRVA